MIIISYKDKYNKYADLNITDFEDQIELLFTVNDQLVDGDNCVDIIANAKTIRYMLSIAMSELDYTPHKINMEKDDATYCLEMFDDGSLEFSYMINIMILYRGLLFIYIKKRLLRICRFCIELLL